MNLEPLLQELMELLQKHGVIIRREPIEESRGGLCTVSGSPVLFLDINADSLHSATLCAQALCRITDITAIYLRPGIRAFIESVTKT